MAGWRESCIVHAAALFFIPMRVSSSQTAGIREPPPATQALATRYQAAREAWNYRIQAANQASQADFLANSAVMPLRNYDPGLGIAKSLLGGTTDLLGIGVKRGVLK